MLNADLWIMNSHDAGAGLQPEVPVLRQILRTEAAQQPAAPRIASHIRGQPVVHINRILRTPDLNTASNGIGRQCGHGHVQGRNFKISREICQWKAEVNFRLGAMCPDVIWWESCGLARLQPDSTVCLIFFISGHQTSSTRKFSTDISDMQAANLIPSVLCGWEWAGSWCCGGQVGSRWWESR